MGTSPVPGSRYTHTNPALDLYRAERNDVLESPTSSFQTAVRSLEDAHTSGPSAPYQRRRSEQSSPSHFQDGDRESSLFDAPLAHASFVDMLLSTWLSHFDYLYDSVQGTSLHSDWLDAKLALPLASGHLSLLSIILALVCQLAPEKTKTMLAACDLPQPDLVKLSQDCMQHTKAESDRFIQEWAANDMVSDRIINSLHCSMLVSAFIKNSGCTTEYRTRLSRDISFLQCCGIHLLDRSDPPPQLVSLTPSSLHQARHLFWAYYQCDRFVWMLDQTHSYQIRRSHADIHFKDQLVSIISSASSECAEGVKARHRGHSSRYTCLMICIAAATEMISDQCFGLEIFKSSP
ncbi:hypothetical protein PaG_05287 [Moesziomyces aphidis]|uniref:Transcription factor domain-containing protein n=1 Tax=Moesziomyces aphidis TaxID=84754 RepID=W3VGE2_MOEAP|nr:hypothetical protein PaG_05287 [Moesziomyces aphidis]